MVNLIYIMISPHVIDFAVLSFTDDELTTTSVIETPHSTPARRRRRRRNEVAQLQASLDHNNENVRDFQYFFLIVLVCVACEPVLCSIDFVTVFIHLNLFHVVYMSTVGM
jgi:hypothetical protein